MSGLILIILIVICAYLSEKPKGDSNSFINKSKFLFRQDKRKRVSWLLVLFYFIAIIYFNPINMPSPSGDWESEIIQQSNQIIANTIVAISFGVIVPLIISLFFSKEKKGISFNIVAIITNYICVLTYI